MHYFTPVSTLLIPGTGASCPSSSKLCHPSAIPRRVTLRVLQFPHPFRGVLWFHRAECQCLS